MNAGVARCLVGIASLFTTVGTVHAGAYVLAGLERTTGPQITLDLITHPHGYNGTGGTLTVTVCLDPSSGNNQMLGPVLNVIDTINARNWVSPNGEENVLSSGQLDIESVILHEMGHATGLNHVNLGSETRDEPSGPSCSDAGINGCDFTKSTDGIDDNDNLNFSDYTLNPGADGVNGSADDVRGNDGNLHWFHMATNSPFTDPATVDASTYSRTLNDLPNDGADLGSQTDTYAANSDRDVAAEFGINHAGNLFSEAMMNQLTFTREIQKLMAADDHVSLRLAEAGLDESQGTGDDYALQLVYGGRLASSACDIVVDFDNNETTFAVTQNCASISGDHATLIPLSSCSAGEVPYTPIYLNTGHNWVYSGRLEMTVTPSNQTIESGQDADFTVTVTNAGGVNLTGVTVSAPSVPDCSASLGTLNAETSTNYNCTASAPGSSFTNAASVSGSPPVGPGAAAVASADVTVDDSNNIFDNGFES